MTPRGKRIVQWATAAESATGAIAYKTSNQLLRNPRKSVRLRAGEVWRQKRATYQE